jgi:ubiquinone/menaquinone biosynthesis C-methylase UbiE
VSSTAEEKYRLWDAYWRDSRLQSAGPDSSPEIEAALDAHWSEAAAALEPEAHVLDLACGNGAVSLVVARVSHEMAKDFKIVGIDAAAIDPLKYLPRHADLLRAIEFHPLTRMEELPFEPGTFDAVFSQYGLEYGDIAKSTLEVARVLKHGGVVIALALPASNSLIEQGAKKSKQAQQILAQTKLFDVALAVAQALHNVESTGESHRDTKQYLERFNNEVERLLARFANAESDMAMATVMALQKVFTDRKSVDISQQLASINMLRKRLTDLVARSEAMARAALGDAGLNGLKRRIQEAGLKDVESKPFSVGSHGTVAWRISAKKP